MPLPIRFPRALAGLGLAGFCAAASSGCGEAPARAQDGRLTVTAREYAELPRRLEAPAGTLTLTLRNRGVLDHDLVVERGDEIVGRLAPVDPGATGTLRVRLEPGHYELECTLWRHADLGEHATLTVR